jgi:transcriptional regulator with XRE-family HTH domain
MEEIKEVEMLRDFKNKSGWSFEKIARQIGVSHQSVMAWINRGVKPNPLARKAIKAFLIDHL